MWQKVETFKGAEYFRKALYVILERQDKDNSGDRFKIIYTLLFFEC